MRFPLSFSLTFSHTVNAYPYIFLNSFLNIGICIRDDTQILLGLITNSWRACHNRNNRQTRNSFWIAGNLLVTPPAKPASHVGTENMPGARLTPLLEMAAGMSRLVGITVSTRCSAECDRHRIVLLIKASI